MFFINYIGEVSPKSICFLKNYIYENAIKYTWTEKGKNITTKVDDIIKILKSKEVLR